MLKIIQREYYSKSISTVVWHKVNRPNRNREQNYINRIQKSVQNKMRIQTGRQAVSQSGTQVYGKITSINKHFKIIRQDSKEKNRKGNEKSTFYDISGTRECSQVFFFSFSLWFDGGNPVKTIFSANYKWIGAYVSMSLCTRAIITRLLQQYSLAIRDKWPNALATSLIALKTELNAWCSLSNLRCPQLNTVLRHIEYVPKIAIPFDIIRYTRLT